MIFLDSSKPDEVERWLKRGIISGVTTNPSIMKKDGTGLNELIEIMRMARPKPVSIELTTNDPDKMLEQAKVFNGLSNNINVKVPIHGPNGESNLEVIRELNSRKIKTNCTVCMSALQCMLGALAGATYVSLFGGRVANMGYEVISEVKKYHSLCLPTLLIMGSVREVHNIIDWLVAGADIITVPPDILEKALIHPYTKETVEMFLKDAGVGG